MLNALLAIAIGSSIGGVSRWMISTRFNHVTLFSLGSFPFGTLLSNLVAGYVIGFAMMLFSHNSNISAEWRLFIVTGFCGGLSTFSTFSVEVITFFQKEQIILAIGTIFAHVMGSLLMTILGILTYQWIKGI